LALSDLVIKGLGAGSIVLTDGTSNLELSNVTIELISNVTFTIGNVLANGPVTAVIKGNNLIFGGTSLLTVNGVTFWKDQAAILDASRGDVTGNITLVNSGVVSYFCRDCTFSAIDVDLSIIDVLVSCCDANGSRIDILETCCEEALSCCDALTSEIDNLFAECSEIDICGIFSQLDVLESCCDANGSRIDVLETCCEEAISCCDAQASQIDTITTQIDILDSCCDVQASQINTITTEIEILDSCCDVLTSQIDNITGVTGPAGPTGATGATGPAGLGSDID
ncbi:unnamed protein product, partial [marine sediment metagenome]